MEIPSTNPHPSIMIYLGLVFYIAVAGLEISKLRVNSKENHSNKEKQNPKIWPRQDS